MVPGLRRAMRPELPGTGTIHHSRFGAFLISADCSKMPKHDDDLRCNLRLGSGDAFSEASRSKVILWN